MDWNAVYTWTARSLLATYALMAVASFAARKPQQGVISVLFVATTAAIYCWRN